MTIDKRALREVAEKATPGPWKVFSDIDTKTFSIHTPRDKRCENVIKWGGFDCQPNAEANAEFIAAFNPKVALALLDENIQLQREKDAIEAVALALRDDMRQSREKLEAAERSIAELERNQTDDVIQFRQRIQELEAKLANPVLLPKTNGYWNEQEKAYEEAITLAKQRIRMAGFRCEGDE
ncbi:TPA: ead/Ea22-like family protein [Salmonella enterica]|nr:ead/Ea22-like family protein [Salmonella enterica]HDC2560414.1 ead/Ea22-like family protein [Salmonella enterica]